MKNIRTTIGGAIGTLGTSLIGVGVMTQLGGDHSRLMWWTTFIGFILSCLGKSISSLFAADAQTVSDLHDQVNAGQPAPEPPKSQP